MVKAIVLSICAAVFILCSPETCAGGTDYDDIAGLIEDNKLDEAEFVLTLRVVADDKDSLALSLLGETYRKKGDRNKALKFLKKAASLNPAYPATHLYLGKLYFTMQDFDKAEEEFKNFRTGMRGLVADKKIRAFYVKGLHDIAIIYVGFKMYDEFYDVVKETLEVFSRDQVATYNMGIYYYIYERNRPKAYEYFKKAIVIDPASALAARAKYAIEYMRNNPDSRMDLDESFIDQEYRD